MRQDDAWPVEAGEDEGVELNLTSLVDVVFALLIVFMVSSAAMVEQGRADAAGGEIELSLPSGSASTAEAPPGEVVVSVDRQGNLYEAGEPTDSKALASRIAAQVGKNPNLQVRIEADEKLTYERVMEVISDLQKLGVRNVGLATRRGGAPGGKSGDAPPAGP
ncbi:MAG: biopolymer transporter ExbD [Deltaproteobacteria bacterium]|nr:biopolymer transporter ExbD [Deltaproteobacteria bacterium]